MLVGCASAVRGDTTSPVVEDPATQRGSIPTAPDVRGELPEAGGGVGPLPTAPEVTLPSTTIPRPSAATGPEETRPPVTSTTTPAPSTSVSATTVAPPTTATTPPECVDAKLTAAHFATNSASVPEDAGRRLDELASHLRTCDCPVTLDGYADPRSTDYPGGNDQLSLDRAEDVRRELVDVRGVPARLVAAVRGHGVEDAAANDLAAGRRVDVTIDCT
jgi:outer membrane protein OmpA-like peptidoglycan-associated protein